MLYAHTCGEDKCDWQSLADHLSSVADLAAVLAGRFGAADFGRAAGMLHDIGKASQEFQKRLEGAKTRVDHSTAGAQEAVSLYGPAAGMILAYAIAGHHSGLLDYGTEADETSLVTRLARRDLKDYSQFRSLGLRLPDRPLRLPVSGSTEIPFRLSFFVRMLYSVLVDADFLDTESVMAPEHAQLRGAYPTVSQLVERLEPALAAKYAGAPDTPINRARAHISRACLESASGAPGLFRLTVPTGGGKTMSSLTFALHHAVTHGLDRVVYVIPFTSIIEQNAAEFRGVLGDDAVVEHHSSFLYPDEASEDWNEDVGRARLATENWDAPVLVTTNVQFFESLFADRSSRARKIHNLSRSVIILDEAQMLPTNLLRPCLAALWELVRNYGSSVVLCTATQPALTALMPADIEATEIVPDQQRMVDVFRRVEVQRLGALTDHELAGLLIENRQALCIVNTRSHARRLFDLARSQPGAMHLSARMCPAHRTTVLAEVKRRLHADEPCLVISTQVVEAGVDVDFPVVFRSAAGLDSLAQAAGRCNREGRRERGLVFTFEPVDQALRGWFQRTASVASMVLRSGADPLSPEAVADYFTQLYDLTGDGLDSEQILARLCEQGQLLRFPFADVAGRFKMIDNDMASIVVPRDKESRSMIAQASVAPSHRLLRQLQPYTVSVYPNEYQLMLRAGQIRIAGGMIPVLTDESLYSEEVGLQPTESLGSAGELLII